MVLFPTGPTSQPPPSGPPVPSHPPKEPKRPSLSYDEYRRLHMKPVVKQQPPPNKQHPTGGYYSFYLTKQGSLSSLLYLNCF